MDPNGVQCSIDCPYDDKTLVGYDSISLLVDHARDSILNPFSLVGVEDDSRTFI